MAIFENAKKLENEELKDVNGGAIYVPFGTGKYEVIHDVTGEQLAVFDNRASANEYCQMNGLSTVYIGLDDINRMRADNGIS